MSNVSRSERNQVIREELVALVKEEYISIEEFKRMMDAQQQYASHLEQKHTFSEQQQEATPMKQEERVERPQKQAVTQPKKKPKKEKSPEQIRERNITWLLILGVSFLLISGLVVATSSWEQMGAILKVFTLIGVSLFFLVLSKLSSSLLKIEKTAFAFLTLGSLLLPIAIIAIGYFELLGSYLSLTGDGRYVLGVICTLVPLPLYARNAWKNQSRLFVWIFFLFLSFFVGFSIAATKLSVDAFYLLIMVYNAALLYVNHRFKQHKTLQLFVKELPTYAQLNLVISTLLMLFVFNQEVFYSFNVFLTAGLYIAMVYIYNTKEYQFIFSALFAYGAYQLTEHSWLQSVDLFVYGLVGAGYLLFAFLMKKDAYLSKMFHYTSALVSIFAFIYITYQGLVIRQNEDSWTLLLAYITIAGTYIYLSYITKTHVFRWIAAIFIYVCGLQFWELAIDPIVNLSGQMFMFLYAGFLFILLGIRPTYKYFQAIKTSVYYVSITVMILSILYSLIIETELQASLMFVLFGLLAWYVSERTHHKENKMANWVNAISWLFAWVMLFPTLITNFSFYQDYLSVSFHFALSGIVLLAISLIWKKVNREGLETSAFYIGQLSYLFSVLYLMQSYTVEEMFVRPIILIIGIGVSVWLVRRTRKTPLWLLVAVMSFVSYVSLLSTFSIETFASTMLFILFAPVLLIGVERFIGIRVPALKPYFFWLAYVVQSITLLVLLIDQLVGTLFNPIYLFIPFLVFIYSTVTRKKEWEVKLLLYASMTMVPFITFANVHYYKLFSNIPETYLWMVSSLIFVVGWLLVPSIWRKRMEWYIIPFSLLSLLVVVGIGRIMSWIDIVIVFAFVLLNLYLLHVRKWSWITVIPLILTMSIWEQQSFIKSETALFLISIGSFFILFMVGNYLYQRVYYFKQGHFFIDWYSIVAVLYITYSFRFLELSDSVWLRIIPYLLLSLWLFIQANRFGQEIIRKIGVTLAVLCFLPPYYLVIGEYQAYIADIFHAELFAFPVLLLAIMLTKFTWKNQARIMRHIQAVLLVMITIYLVVDAIQSNTVWDALIIGTLSIVSFLAGMKLRIKSYFFVGLGTLIFNVMYQTKPFWGNMPWWSYLLIAGITLIVIASYNEWLKQRNTEGKLWRKVKQTMTAFKKWN